MSTPAVIIAKSPSQESLVHVPLDDNDVTGTNTKGQDVKVETQTKAWSTPVRLAIGFLTLLGLTLIAYAAEANYASLTKAAVFVGENSWAFGGALLGAALILSTLYGLHLAFKPESAEAKESRIAKKTEVLEKAVAEAKTDVEAKAEAVAAAKTALDEADQAVANSPNKDKKAAEDKEGYAAHQVLVKTASEKKIAHADAVSAHTAAQTKLEKAEKALTDHQKAIAPKKDESSANSTSTTTANSTGGGNDGGSDTTSLV